MVFETGPAINSMLVRINQILLQHSKRYRAVLGRGFYDDRIRARAQCNEGDYR